MPSKGPVDVGEEAKTLANRTPTTINLSLLTVSSTSPLHYSVRGSERFRLIGRRSFFGGEPIGYFFSAKAARDWSRCEAMSVLR